MCVKNKALFINGERLKYEFVGRIPDVYERVEVRPGVYQEIEVSAREYLETINGVTHRVRRYSERPPRKYPPGKDEWMVIPEGEYLMMGDNRDASSDSRSWGLAKEEQIVGKAVAIWMHKEPGLNWPTFARNQWLNEPLEEAAQ